MEDVENTRNIVCSANPQIIAGIRKPNLHAGARTVTLPILSREAAQMSSKAEAFQEGPWRLRPRRSHFWVAVRPIRLDSFFGNGQVLKKARTRWFPGPLWRIRPRPDGRRLPRFRERRDPIGKSAQFRGVSSFFKLSLNRASARVNFRFLATI